MATNLFAIEQLLIERISANIPELKTVASASVLSQQDDIIAQCDAVYTIPGTGDAEGTSHSVSVVQQWIILVTVRKVFDTADTDTTATKGGDLAGQIIKLLHNWEPSTDFFKMHFAGHGSAYFGAGYGEFPLYFNVKTVFRGLST
ncbi:MAG: hypothetical protein KZQ94_10435 [Candidatus Thiodiazotropha sp. (ex Troendleina suluensis)]|nr:hypothetical protein [Candidatus Thiodiazotropha sp. (ex Troendleina suluensis)]